MVIFETDYAHERVAEASFAVETGKSILIKRLVLIADFPQSDHDKEMVAFDDILRSADAYIEDYNKTVKGVRIRGLYVYGNDGKMIAEMDYSKSAIASELSAA